MASRNRSNPLALAVLICLYERPMHPYEVATTLRQRNKHESVRLNYGSLYAVVASLERRGLITPLETAREGRLPERTVYELTDAGRVETHDWLTDLIASPVKEYPSFEAALSFLPALPPDDVVGLLRERALRLETRSPRRRHHEDVAEKMGLPRLFSVEGSSGSSCSRPSSTLSAAWPPTSSRERWTGSTGGGPSTGRRRSASLLPPFTDQS